MPPNDQRWHLDNEMSLHINTTYVKGILGLVENRVVQAEGIRILTNLMPVTKIESKDNDLSSTHTLSVILCLLS